VGTLILALSTKTETSITINWASEYDLNGLWYSLDGGQSYTKTEQTGLEGFLSFYDLQPNMTYEIVLKGQEKALNDIIFSELMDVITYDYPFCSVMPDFTIGEKLTLNFYNPLDREITVNLLGADGSVISNDTISGKTLTGFFDENVVDRLYRSIPNEASAHYSVKTSFSDVSVKTVQGGVYSVDKNECAPVLGNVFYEDRDPFTVTITGDDQVLVQNRSFPYFTANGIYSKKYATITDVRVVFNEQEYSLPLNNHEAAGFGGAVDSSTPLYAIFEVEDSRGLITQKEKFLNIQAWSPPEGILSLNRTSLGTSGSIKVDASFSLVLDKNTLTIDFYKKKRSETEYTYEGVLVNGEETSFLADSTFDWDVKVVLTDRFNGTNTLYATLNRYTPLIFFDAQKYSVGVNCLPASNGTLEIKNEDVYASLFYSAGENFSLSGKKVYCPGFFRDNAVYFSIYTEKSIKNVNPTITELKINACKNSSGCFFSSYQSSGYDVIADTSITVTCTKQSDKNILVKLASSSTISENNYSQVIVEIISLNVVFS
jgi:hypothetical protein